jgi:hypothetical protein
MLQDSFDSLAELWAERLSQATGSVVNMNRTDTAKLESMREAYVTLNPAAERLIGFSLGTAGLSDLPNPELARILNIMPRFFGAPSVNQLSHPAAAQLAAEVSRIHALGIVSHLLLFTHPSRNKIPQVPLGQLVNAVLEHAGIADKALASYSAKANNAPAQVARQHFSHQIRPLLRTTFGIGFWTLGKVTAHIQNVFWIGSFLAMQAELLADQR